MCLKQYSVGFSRNIWVLPGTKYWRGLDKPPQGQLSNMNRIKAFQLFLWSSCLLQTSFRWRKTYIYIYTHTYTHTHAHMKYTCTDLKCISTLWKTKRKISQIYHCLLSLQSQGICFIFAFKHFCINLYKFSIPTSPSRVWVLHYARVSHFCKSLFHSILIFYQAIYK